MLSSPVSEAVVAPVTQKSLALAIALTINVYLQASILSNSESRWNAAYDLARQLAGIAFCAFHDVVDLRQNFSIRVASLSFALSSFVLTSIVQLAKAHTMQFSFLGFQSSLFRLFSLSSSPQHLFPSLLFSYSLFSRCI
jgi:hypothetical protein